MQESYKLARKDLIGQSNSFMYHLEICIGVGRHLGNVGLQRKLIFSDLQRHGVLSTT